VITAWLVWTALLRAEFEERLDALRAAGVPVDPEDLRSQPVAAADNAAPLLQRSTPSRSTRCRL
jgi:hypothetical protein